MNGAHKSFLRSLIITKDLEREVHIFISIKLTATSTPFFVCSIAYPYSYYLSLLVGNLFRFHFSQNKKKILKKYMKTNAFLSHSGYKTTMSIFFLSNLLTRFKRNLLNEFIY